MEINIGIIGFGVVGRGVTSLLKEYGSLLQNRVDIKINVKTIADIDIKTDRGIDLGDTKLTTNYKDIIEDKDIQIVIELVGGTGIAHTIIKEALTAAKHVVTANKALIYKEGERVFKLALEKEREIRFEASVGGGIPIIKTVTESLSGDKINEICAILNGTTNFILTKMVEEKQPFDTALKEAQKLGFAEADPTLDITGADAAHKIAILSSVSFNTKVENDKVYREGIDKIQLDDILYAKELGYTIKLLAIAKRHDDTKSVEVHVYPTLIPNSSNLASVRNEYNAVMLESDYLGISHYVGKGAGERATATAIASDIVDISLAVCDKRDYPDHRYVFFNDYKTMDIGQINSCFYIRLMAIEKVGILAEVARILAKHNISISQLSQKTPLENTPVPIIIITNNAKESSMLDAIKEIAALEYFSEKPVLLHLENI